MTSQSKKNKAKNSYLMYGADKLDLKMKRVLHVMPSATAIRKCAELLKR